MRRRPKGSGTIKREGAGWSLRLKRRGEEVYESGFRTRQEAEARAALLRAETIHQRLGRAADPRLAPALADLAKSWLERRKTTHAAGAEDNYRWTKHLAPAFGHLRPDEVGLAELRAFIESKRSEVAPGTVRVLVAILSALYEDLLERQLASRNPCKGLPRSVLRLMRSEYDPKTTPFVEKLEDVSRIYHGLRAVDEGLAVGYAIGALAGLRTGEVLALRWRSVDLAARRILVSESVKGQVKDREPRTVPIVDGLLAVLKAWHLKSGGEGLVVPPLRVDGDHVDKGTPGRALRPVLRHLKLQRLAEHRKAWYCATRHTCASHWVMAGRPLREVQKLLGHSSIAVTERYAHLAPDYWADGVHQALAVDLAAGAGVVGRIAENRTEPPGIAKPSTRNRKTKTGVAL